MTTSTSTTRNRSTPHRALAVGDDGTLRPVTVPSATPGPGEAVVDVARCGICGSDLHLLSAGLPPAGAVLGHEIAGRIAALAGDTAGWSVGDRVTVLPFDPCGACAECTSGHRTLCRRAMRRGLGLGIVPGGFADQVVVQASMLFAIPDAVSDDAAALTEPLAVAVRAARLSGAVAETPAAVIGGGPLGLFAGLALRALGLDRVVLLETNPERARRAEALGLPCEPADVVRGRRSEALGGALPAVVLECAGHPATANLAIELVAPAGTVVLVGVLYEPSPIGQIAVVAKEAVVRGSFGYDREDFATAIAVLAEDGVPVEQIVTERVRLEQVPRAIDELTAPGTRHVKVLACP